MPAHNVPRGSDFTTDNQEADASVAERWVNRVESIGTDVSLDDACAYQLRHPSVLTMEAAEPWD